MKYTRRIATLAAADIMEVGQIEIIKEGNRTAHVYIRTVDDKPLYMLDYRVDGFTQTGCSFRTMGKLKARITSTTGADFEG